jgi:branched-chain amino acid aminotransferase
MIWAAGRVLRDDALTIGVLDRTFEHGLGLFETLRTWNRRATLLDRHLARLARSAESLGIPLDRAALPGAEAVAELLGEAGIEADALLRITLTGGLSDSGGSTLWMRAASLPSRREATGAAVDLGSWRVDRDDRLARHKSLNYWARRIAYDGARERGLDEVVSRTADGCLWEGSRTNLFLVVGDRLVTPTLDGPIVPGVMRALVLERAAALPLEVAERGEVKFDDVRAAGEVFLTNSVRGLIPVARAGELEWESPGPVCRRLQVLVSEWLLAGGQR